MIAFPASLALGGIGVTAMTNPATPMLLSLIRKIREERRSGDLTRLTDAELLAKLARGLSSDTGDERLIACAAAVTRMAPHARRDQRDGDLREGMAYSRKPVVQDFPRSSSPRCANRRPFANCGTLGHRLLCGESSVQILRRPSVPIFSNGSASYQSRRERPRAAKSDGCRNSTAFIEPNSISARRGQPKGCQWVAAARRPAPPLLGSLHQKRYHQLRFPCSNRCRKMRRPWWKRFAG